MFPSAPCIRRIEASIKELHNVNTVVYKLQGIRNTETLQTNLSNTHALLDKVVRTSLSYLCARASLYFKCRAGPHCNSPCQ